MYLKLPALEHAREVGNDGVQEVRVAVVALVALRRVLRVDVHAEQADPRVPPSEVRLGLNVVVDEE